MASGTPNRILITGGAGFIGSHTADALLRKGYAVRVLDCLDPQIHGENAGFPDYLAPEVECHRGDVCNPDDVAAALEDVDGVYHFAALTGVGQSMYDLRSYVHTNCTGTATLFETIVKHRFPIRKVVLASSRAVYGEGTHECAVHGEIFPGTRRREDLEQGRFDVHCPHCGQALRSIPTREERPLLPISVYAWTKKQQEEYSQYAARTFDIPVTALRYFNVYGSRQSLRNPYTGVVSIFYNRIMASQPVSLYEQGKPGRDFVHISDIVQANLLALDTDTGPWSCINVGAGVDSAIKDVASALASACGRSPEFLDLGEYRVGDIHSCYADLDRAERLLGYRPRMALADGMQEFVDWALHQQSEDNYQRTVDELQRYGLFGRAGSSVE